MTSSIGTLINNAYENTSVFNACMQVGIGASAFLTCSQLGVGMFGIMPLILSPSVVKHQPTNFQQNPKQFAQMWNFFFQKATKPVVGSVLISSLAFFIAAFNVPSVNAATSAKTFFSSSSNTINNDVQIASRNFLFFTALVAISPLPFTAIRLLPNIQTLQKLLQKDVWTKADEQLAIKNVKLWNSGHKIRVTIYALSTLLGIFAYNAAPKS